MRLLPPAIFVLFLIAVSLPGWAQQRQTHTLTVATGKTITLSLPARFDINIAARGLGRVRFFAQAPDGRIFVTGMHDISDNRRGSIFILDGWNEQTHTFARVVPYLDRLHNPNSIAFWKDAKTGQSWLYLALTEKLVRYPYHAGDLKPTGPAETLMRFPDYGLNYKYGGWHLTRTVAVGQVGGVPRIFVSVGSSCNYCQEREVARASILSMDPDGKNARIIAQGMRNGVDVHYLPDVNGGSLFATNMGDDHLGDKLPDDTFFHVDAAPGQPVNYGWPACYFAGGTAVHDTTPLPSVEDPELRAHTDQPLREDNESVYGKQRGVAAAGTNLAAGGGHAAEPDPNAELGQPPAPLKSCESVPRPYAWFAAHSSPLGFAHFSAADSEIGDSFLVALHGASHPHIGTGYRVVLFTPANRKPKDFITGFLTLDHGKATVHGRPCGLLRMGPDAFLLSDDFLGVVYFVHAKT